MKSITQIFKGKNRLCYSMLLCSYVFNFPPQPISAQPPSAAASDSIRKAMDSIRKLSEADHRLMMTNLNIQSLRPGPSGNPSAPNAANVDESKAVAYTSIPDPLVLKNGQKVTNAKMWWNKRRP